MKKAILITIYIEDSSKTLKLTSENEPSKVQIETMLTDLYGKTSTTFDLKNVQFKQSKGRLKKYSYLINEGYYCTYCTVEVEWLDLVKFHK